MPSKHPPADKPDAHATPTAAPVPDEATAVVAPPAPPRRPSMGETVMVQAREGALLLNNETGGFFAVGVPTPQTVSVTLLRRLYDRDLQLV